MVLESEPHSQQKKRIGEQIREAGIQQTHRNGPGTNKTKNKKKYQIASSGNDDTLDYLSHPRNSYPSFLQLCYT